MDLIQAYADQENYNITIGGKIKYLRESNNLTQTALAKKLEVDRSTLGQWEINRRVPNFEKLQEIARCCGVDISFFATDTEDEIFYTEEELKIIKDIGKQALLDMDNKKNAPTKIDLADASNIFYIDGKTLKKDDMEKVKAYVRGLLDGRD